MLDLVYSFLVIRAGTFRFLPQLSNEITKWFCNNLLYWLFQVPAKIANCLEQCCVLWNLKLNFPTLTSAQSLECFKSWCTFIIPVNVVSQNGLYASLTHSSTRVLYSATWTFDEVRPANASDPTIFERFTFLLDPDCALYRRGGVSLGHRHKNPF